jgi:hypothetical protein
VHFILENSTSVRHYQWSQKVVRNSILLLNNLVRANF